MNFYWMKRKYVLMSEFREVIVCNRRYRCHRLDVYWWSVCIVYCLVACWCDVTRFFCGVLVKSPAALHNCHDSGQRLQYWPLPRDLMEVFYLIKLKMEPWSPMNSSNREHLMQYLSFCIIVFCGHSAIFLTFSITFVTYRRKRQFEFKLNSRRLVSISENLFFSMQLDISKRLR